jgi:NNP family nitrate/nitrite transporter-like MFS transporter
MAPAGQTRGSFRAACRDYRTWLLALLYGACFGVELTLKNVAALYFVDYFGLGLAAAGWAAAAYGLMNLFARTLGGLVSDRCAARWGLWGRTRWLFMALAGEGVALVAFSQAGALELAIGLLVVTGLFVQMSNGATYSIVPFVQRGSLGSVAGIVGAGGNLGAVAAGFLFQGAWAWNTALLTLGLVVLSLSGAALALRFVPRGADAPAAMEPVAEPLVPAGAT